MQTAERTEPKFVEELIIERAKYSYARLPMLEVVFDRFALSLSQVLKTYLGAMTDVELESVDYLSCADAVDGLPDPALNAVTEAEGWAGPLAVVIEPSLLFAVIEITFGGRTVPGAERNTRSFTAIEKRIGESLCEVTLDDLARAFAKVAPTEFAISHLETNPRALLLGPPTSACVRAVMRIETEGRSGRMMFVLPNASFEPVNHVLGQAFTGGQLGGDTGWRNKMTGMLGHTSVTLTALMGETQVPLRDVLGWTKGTVLDFGMQENDPVTLTCAEMPVARAEVGKRKNGRVALKLSEKLYTDDEELAQHVLDR
ncbi:flagellar motor switch protein FliM [Pseudooceanicola sp. LIPI14-2-Ac024]|uniref:flagellar motor switch protein FliM n=1 Tax=Pseudooceanicola sp. LIPI14-2-Ac024 TaxID=3344875 RepID=UPI0035D03787